MAPPVPPRPADAATRTVVVTGASSALGRRVCAALAAGAGVGRVVAIDRTPAPDQPGVESHALPGADLAGLVGVADAVVHLGLSGGVDLDGTGVGPDPQLTRDLLEAVDGSTVRRLVLLSSATVYGAWKNNPVPLTEEAPLRPVPGLAFAAERAEDERLVGEWGETHPDVVTAVLRTALTAAPDTQEWMGRSPWPRVGVQIDDRQPPAQFLHLDDLARAVVLLIDPSTPVDGHAVLNAAPDGWIPPDTLRALVSPAPAIRMPHPIATRVAGLRWRLGMAELPPGVLPYTTQPWVVANDRLRALGWQADSTNEEAFVAGHRAGPLATMSPRRRQELSLLATGAVAAGAVAVVTLAARRRLRRRA